MNSPNDINQQRYKKLEEIRSRGIDPYPLRFDVSHSAQSILENAEELIESGKSVTVAGRIISKRGHGKSGFSHLLDRTNRIQIYVRLDRIDSEIFELYDQLIEVGDFLGIKGTVV